MRAEVILAAAAALTTVSAGPIESRANAGSKSSIANFKDKIKTVVFLIMENRSVDNLLGGQKVDGLNNPINKGSFCNPFDPSNPHHDNICSEPNDYDSILNDPDHSVHGNNYEFFSTFNPDNDAIADGSLKPLMRGFIGEQVRLYGQKVTSNDTLVKQVMNYYTEDQVPVITALTHNFTVFNRWHSDHPGPTNPNRLYATSGGSHGKGTNNFAYNTINARSIFQTVDELGISWKNYITDTGMQDAAWYTWTYDNNKTDHIVSLDEFYADAAAGTLPQLTYLNPSCCGVGTTSMHPAGLISDGEQFLKDVYEALRSSPQWNETLWVLTYDETGGFHDHVQPPLAVRPDNLTYTETVPTGEKYTFSFNRLGGRVPTWLISPWVAPRVVQQGLNRVGETGSYSASSIISSLSYLWDFEPLTPRVEHAPSFDHLILSEPRDTPEKLPEAINFRREKE
ncbi:Phosphoesterase superfamily protein [Pleurostoma richardsiae]|uniref:Phosphoesterase superfamily protein n=1 Tax=Pleurostoma richardsiae TaxID=41990 RepID=A0AA38RZW1_9PEZI|nr:Phosphoesterase superfamily protein [Pleurostoma richardsiae]